MKKQRIVFTGGTGKAGPTFAGQGLFHFECGFKAP